MTTRPMQNTLSYRAGLPLLATLCCLAFQSALAQSAAPQSIAQRAAGDTIVLPSGFRDPIEPFNRAMWGFNKGFMNSVVRPFSRGYRYVVVKPVRTGIGKIGKNITYPDRL